MTKRRTATILGLEVSINHAGVTGLSLMGLLGATLSLALLTRSLPLAILAGPVVVFLHLAAAFVHQLGHAAAAASTGYPMHGVRFGRWGILATSLYPQGEPELPAHLHRRRAIGGPLASTLFGGLCLAAAYLLRTASPLAAGLAALTGLDSLALFALGALLPLGFTDMSTLLRYRGKSASVER